MKKILFITLFLFVSLFGICFSQEQIQENFDESSQDNFLILEEEIINESQEIFEARVIKVLKEKEVINNEDGFKIKQQNLLLEALNGSIKGQQFEYKGISNFEIVNIGTYKAGDKLVIQKTSYGDSEDKFFITDFVRKNYLYLLFILFVISIILVGSFKGLRSLISLAISFFIIIKFVLPQILNGANPLIVGLIGAFVILVVIIYITEGFHKKSHIAIISVFFSLIITFILSYIFTKLTRLSGIAQEEASFLIGITKHQINFQGLLLAGILIGTVGVLDDVIIGQIEAVKQIKEANSNLKTKEVFKMAYKIGNTHLGAIVNTLFLAYAGASLPLLLLFSVGQEPFLSFSQVINNELIATEIVRSLIGSIGIAISMPIATYLASKYLIIKNKNI